MMQAIIFAGCSLILIAALLWLLLPRTVVEIPGADAEDREMFGLVCQPEALNEILEDVNHVFNNVHQIDLLIQVLAKRGHVIIGPCREDIKQAASLLEGRIIP